MSAKPLRPQNRLSVAPVCAQKMIIRYELLQYATDLKLSKAVEIYLAKIPIDKNNIVMTYDTQIAYNITVISL